MDVKTILIKNNNETFQEEIKKAISMGYKIRASNISVEPIFTNALVEYHKENIFYYALMIKES